MIQGINLQSTAPQDAVRRPGAAQASLPNAFAALFQAQTEPAGASAQQPAPAAATPAPAAAAEPAPAAAALPPQPAGVPIAYGPAAIEDHMNRWYMELMQHINGNRMEVYNQAMADWKVNAARHRDLGLPDLPAPEAPQLEAVEPKPEGWWFQIHS
jgi:hypothetical protein